MSIEKVIAKGKASIDGDGINPYTRIDYRRAWHKGRADALRNRYTTETDETKKKALEKRFNVELRRSHQ